MDARKKKESEDEGTRYTGRLLFFSSLRGARVLPPARSIRQASREEFLTDKRTGHGRKGMSNRYHYIDVRACVRNTNQMKINTFICVLHLREIVREKRQVAKISLC